MTNLRLERYCINDATQMEWLIDYEYSLRLHIKYVVEAGSKIGVPREQLLAHDESKFSVEEFPHYARQFHGDRLDPEGFAAAWLHHQNFNPHHWEYWITRSDHSKGASRAFNGALPMPYHYVQEMVADWMGASRVYTRSWLMDGWLSENVRKMNLHPETVDRLNHVLTHAGYLPRGSFGYVATERALEVQSALEAKRP